MTEQEKEMYLEKLRVEIEEYRHREATYEAKRAELLQMENAFRAVQSKTVAADFRGRDKKAV